VDSDADSIRKELREKDRERQKFEAMHSEEKDSRRKTLGNRIMERPPA
jgi:hypothetical protein